MATNRPRATGRQELLLEWALSSPSFIAVRSLSEVIHELGDEPLDPRWGDLWCRIREVVIRDQEAPENIIEQIDRAIAGITSIDQEIDQIRLSPHERECLLLGAGASTPPPSSIPTVAALLPELWRRARKLGRDDIDRLATWCDERNVSNIEDLLTAAYLANFAAKSASISGLLNYFLFRDRESDESLSRRLPRSVRMASQVDASSIALFQETLQGLFGLLTGTMIPAAPNAGHGAAVQFVKQRPLATIITTNYDGCVDEALIKGSVPFITHVSEASSADGQSLDLIKIHGSINWSYCDSCHEVREFDLNQAT